MPLSGVPQPQKFAFMAADWEPLAPSCPLGLSCSESSGCIQESPREMFAERRAPEAAAVHTQHPPQPPQTPQQRGFAQFPARGSDPSPAYPALGLPGVDHQQRGLLAIHGQRALVGHLCKTPGEPGRCRNSLGQQRPSAGPPRPHWAPPGLARGSLRARGAAASPPPPPGPVASDPTTEGPRQARGAPTSVLLQQIPLLDAGEGVGQAGFAHAGVPQQHHAVLGLPAPRRARGFGGPTAPGCRSPAARLRGRVAELGVPGLAPCRGSRCPGPRQRGAGPPPQRALAPALRVQGHRRHRGQRGREPRGVPGSLRSPAAPLLRRSSPTLQPRGHGNGLAGPGLLSQKFGPNFSQTGLTSAELLGTAARPRSGEALKTGRWSPRRSRSLPCPTPPSPSTARTPGALPGPRGPRGAPGAGAGRGAPGHDPSGSGEKRGGKAAPGLPGSPVPSRPVPVARGLRHAPVPPGAGPPPGPRAPRPVPSRLHLAAARGSARPPPLRQVRSEPSPVLPRCLPPERGCEGSAAPVWQPVTDSRTGGVFRTGQHGGCFYLNLSLALAPTQAPGWLRAGSPALHRDVPTPGHPRTPLPVTAPRWRGPFGAAPMALGGSDGAGG